MQIQIEHESCHGVEVERPNGTTTVYRRDQRGSPVVTMPESDGRTALCNFDGVSRYSKSFNISAPWLPEKRLKLWTD